MRLCPNIIVVLVALVVLGSCRGDDGPTGALAGVARVAFQPSLIPSAADGSALPINLIRTVVVRDSDGVVLRERSFAVAPTATTWSIDVDVPASGGPTVVVVYFYLINVDANGAETVQFSGRTLPTNVTAGEQITGVGADIVRGGPANLAVTGVAIGPHPDTVVIGSTVSLAATATTNGPQTPDIFWTALDPAVVGAVDSVVTGVTPGTGRVVASAGRFADTTMIVVIPPPVDSVRVLPDSADILLGGTQTYATQLRDAGGNLLTGRTVFWSSSDTTIARVDQGGVVTTVGLGKTNVRATSEGRFDEAVVRVVNVPVRSVLVSPDSAVVQAGSTVSFAVQTRDSIGGVLTGRAVTWSTDSAAIATVNASGVVTGVSAGTTTVRATSEGVSDTATVRVTAAPVVPTNLNRWVGASSGTSSWSTAANWSKNAIPAPGDSVVIDALGSYTVTLSADATVGALTIGRTGSTPQLTLGGTGLTLSVTGALTNGGAIVFQDNASNAVPMVLDAQGGLTNRTAGVVVAGGSGDLPQIRGEITNQGSIWTQSQTLLIPPTLDAVHTNSGDIHAAGGGIIIQLTAGTSSLLSSGSIHADAGRTITVTGGTFTNEVSGQIKGEGTVSVSGTAFTNAGRITPGLVTGILTIDGASAWMPTGSLEIFIGGLTAGGGYDRLEHVGAIALDGTLSVSVSAFQPQDGDRFAVMTFDGRSGTFGSVLLPSIQGIALDTLWAEGPGIDTLYITASATPSIALNAVIGPSGTNADSIDAPGSPVNLVGTASGSGPTTLAAGAAPLPTFDFNTLGGIDRTTGFDRGDLLEVRADQKHDATALLLDLDDDASFVGESAQPGFGMHANRFVTFDLSVIRASASYAANQAFTLSGTAGPANAFPISGMSFMVLLDGVPVMVHDVATGASTPQPFTVPVSGSGRYLTFIALEGAGLEPSYDHGGFAQVTLWARGPVSVSDATTDFSSTQNPNGVWNSGWTASLGSTLNAYPSTTGNVSWYDPPIDIATTPSFSKNLTGSIVTGIPPGMISLHGGCNAGEYSELRWTAPSFGRYIVNVVFLSGDSGNTDGAVLLNGAPLLPPTSTSAGLTYFGDRWIDSADRIQIVVGTGQDGCSGDSTPLSVSIVRS